MTILYIKIEYLYIIHIFAMFDYEANLPIILSKLENINIIISNYITKSYICEKTINDQEVEFVLCLDNENINEVINMIKNNYEILEKILNINPINQYEYSCKLYKNDDNDLLYSVIFLDYRNVSYGEISIRNNIIKINDTIIDKNIQDAEIFELLKIY